MCQLFSDPISSLQITSCLSSLVLTPLSFSSFLINIRVKCILWMNVKRSQHREIHHIFLHFPLVWHWLWEAGDICEAWQTGRGKSLWIPTCQQLHSEGLVLIYSIHCCSIWATHYAWSWLYWTRTKQVSGVVCEVIRNIRHSVSQTSQGGGRAYCNRYSTSTVVYLPTAYSWCPISCLGLTWPARLNNKKNLHSHHVLRCSALNLARHHWCT